MSVQLFNIKNQKENIIIIKKILLKKKSINHEEYILIRWEKKLMSSLMWIKWNYKTTQNYKLIKKIWKWVFFPNKNVDVADLHMKV